jgi:mitotic spindle assembly checkpoint protein MAD1
MNAIPDTPAATPVSITQSLSVLRLEHAHLLEEHGANRAALRRCQAELADAQTREVDARATADTLLHASRAAEDRAMRAERSAALSEREVGFLQALNVRSCHRSLAFLIAFIFLATNRRVTQTKKLRKVRVT